MPTTMTVSQARAALPQILERVRAGEEVTLTRHGEPVAVVVRPDRLRKRRVSDALAAADRVHELIERARYRPLSEPTLDEARAEVLLAEVRASRVAR